MRQSDQVVHTHSAAGVCRADAVARCFQRNPGPMRILLLTVFCSSLVGCNLAFGRKASAPDEGFWALSEDSRPLGGLFNRDAQDKARKQRLYSGQGEKELAAAETIEVSDPVKAAKLYERVAKRYLDSNTGEEAQIRAANIWFESQRYAKAQDAYAQLLDDYPSTRYMKQATTRLFSIARTWLNVTNPETTSKIKLASHEETPPDVPDPGFKATVAVPILPNFTDRSRPVFDTQGRAIEALRTIWLSDPTGDLADDALMMTATYYLQKRDYVESDRFFRILREEYPRSPHLENAYLLGSHVKLMSYQGPQYEGLTLAESKKLKERSLRLFSDKHGERLREELDKVDDEMARRDWENVQYYQRKKRPRSIAIACQQVIENHPNSKYAEQARQIISTIDPVHVKGLPGFGINSAPAKIADKPLPTGETRARY